MSEKGLHHEIGGAAIREGLGKVRAEAAWLGASPHVPRIGAGLAGGDWAQLESFRKNSAD